jgi:hypothetical protein
MPVHERVRNISGGVEKGWQVKSNKIKAIGGDT